MKVGTRRRKKLLLTILTCLLLCLGIAFDNQKNISIGNTSQIKTTQSALNTGYYKVVRFDDGDTIVVDMDGHNETIRFIGVDTPEVKDPRKPVQCFGKSASQFTKNLIGNQSVRLEADPTNTNRDRYNRLLRYVYLPDGRLVNAEIIKQGYGFAYTSFPFTKKEEFKKYESQARNENRGLWGSCQTGKDEKGHNTINNDPNP